MELSWPKFLRKPSANDFDFDDDDDDNDNGDVSCNSVQGVLVAD